MYAIRSYYDYAANQALELLTYTPHVTLLLNGKPPVMSDAYRARLAEAGIPVRLV